MAKPERWRLNPASYPVQQECTTRFQDMDLNKHLNKHFSKLFDDRATHRAPFQEIKPVLEHGIA